MAIQIFVIVRVIYKIVENSLAIVRNSMELLRMKRHPVDGSVIRVTGWHFGAEVTEPFGTVLSEL